MDYKLVEDYIRNDEELRYWYQTDPTFCHFIHTLRCISTLNETEHVRLMLETMKALVKEKTELRMKIMEYVDRYGIIKKEENSLV